MCLIDFVLECSCHHTWEAMCRFYKFYYQQQFDPIHEWYELQNALRSHLMQYIVYEAKGWLKNGKLSSAYQYFICAHTFLWSTIWTLHNTFLLIYSSKEKIVGRTKKIFYTGRKEACICPGPVSLNIIERLGKGLFNTIFNALVYPMHVMCMWCYGCVIICCYTMDGLHAEGFDTILYIST